MNLETAKRCVKAMEIRWKSPKLSEQEFAALVDWYGPKPVTEKQVIVALDDLRDTQDFMPKPSQIYAALAAAGALGAPIPGNGDPRIVNKMMKGIEADCAISAHNLGITLNDAIAAHQRQCRENYVDTDATDAEWRGIWADRITACERLLAKSAQGELEDAAL